MQPARPPPLRPPAPASSSSPVPSPSDALPPLPRPRPPRMESWSSEDDSSSYLAASRSKTSQPQPSSAVSQQHQQRNHTPTPIYASFTSHPNSSASSLHNNFSRPSAGSSNLSPAAAAAARAASYDRESSRGSSPLTLPPSSSSTGLTRSFYHGRKHSSTAPGSFQAVLPSTSTSNLPHIATMASAQSPPPQQQRELSASHIAAQAAVMYHQNRDQQQPQSQQQPQQQQLQLPQNHNTRQRSQTAPAQPGDDVSSYQPGHKRGSGGPLSPPMLSLTEASAPRDTGFSGSYQHSSAAQAAASLVFPRSGQLSGQVHAPPPPPPPPPPPLPVKAEKSKVKLFSRPGKIYTKGESKEKPQPSPGKIGAALSSLQRGNFSTTSLDTSAQSFYSLGNSSAATIRPAETPVEEKSKEKRHYFLSRQKHKLKDNDEFHLPLSSSKSNSRPTDPSAPSSLYNFNIPASPAASSTTFKSKSGLDLRHGGRALREKRREDGDSTLNLPSDWNGPGSLGSQTQSSLYLHEPVDSGKLGLNSIALEDAWPFIKAKLLVIFEGEDLRLPVEDLNRVVTMHIQYTITKRQPCIIVDDLRELLGTGFASLDMALRKTPEDKLIPALVELWVFTFTVILPYIQAVFLPLDLEFAGAGSLMKPEQSREFWGGVRARSYSDASSTQGSVTISPVSSLLDVRRMVLTSYRDKVILPRFDTLKAMFSRLSLEFLPQSLALTSPLPIPRPPHDGSGSLFGTSPSGDSAGSFSLNSVSYLPRPGTAMSLDPSMASYNSTGSTLLGGDGVGPGGRSRAISNVSYGSDGGLRPFTPGHARSNSNLQQEQNAENSKQVTEMVGRMLQCMSVLSSIGTAQAAAGDEDNRVGELCRLLKLNWLGRGRTGRNRRGLVGGRVRRGVGDLSAVAGGGGFLGSFGGVREEVSVP